MKWVLVEKFNEGSNYNRFQFSTPIQGGDRESKCGLQIEQKIKWIANCKLILLSMSFVYSTMALNAANRKHSIHFSVGTCK